jgi:predicted N-formylglutamate amidohydrolase
MGIRGSILIIVDHANNFIPSKYKNLGLPKISLKVILLMT